MDRASAAETIDSGSIPGGVKKTKTRKIKIHSFPTVSIERGSVNVKPPPCVIDRWQLD